MSYLGGVHLISGLAHYQSNDLTTLLHGGTHRNKLVYFELIGRLDNIQACKYKQEED